MASPAINLYLNRTLLPQCDKDSRVYTQALWLYQWPTKGVTLVTESVAEFCVNDA